MDFGTIKRKRLDEYPQIYPKSTNCPRWDRCCLSTATPFNLPDDPVLDMGKELQAKFNELSASRGLKTIHVDMPTVTAVPVKNGLPAVKREVGERGPLTAFLSRYTMHYHFVYANIGFWNGCKKATDRCLKSALL